MKSVFLLEDTPALRVLLSLLLVDLGWEVTASSTVREAKELLRAIPRPDIALLDYNLPDGKGPEIAKVIRKRWRSAVRIISISVGDMGDARSWNREEREFYDRICMKPNNIEGVEAILQAPGNP